jgi:hypothetical protein
MSDQQTARLATVRNIAETYDVPKAVSEALAVVDEVHAGHLDDGPDLVTVVPTLKPRDVAALVRDLAERHARKQQAIVAIDQLRSLTTHRALVALAEAAPTITAQMRAPFNAAADRFRTAVADLPDVDDLQPATMLTFGGRAVIAGEQASAAVDELDAIRHQRDVIDSLVRPLNPPDLELAHVLASFCTVSSDADLFAIITRPDVPTWLLLTRTHGVELEWQPTDPAREQELRHRLDEANTTGRRANHSANRKRQAAMGFR